MSVVQLAPAAATVTVADPSATKAAPEPVPKIGMRVNGKNWHASKKPFRPTAGQTSYAKRKEHETLKQATKAREHEMREEKEAERNRRIQAIKDRRKAKEEKERYEKMAEKMHKKVVERRKRREKRNKLLKS